MPNKKQFLAAVGLVNAFVGRALTDGNAKECRKLFPIVLRLAERLLEI